MSFTHVSGQSVVGTATSGFTVQAVFPNNPAKGNLVCIGIIYFSGGSLGSSIISILDGNSNSYIVTAASPSGYDINAGQVFLSYLLVAPVNSNKTITITFNDPISTGICWADEFLPDTGNVAVFDNSIAGSGTGLTVNSPTVTPTHTNSLLYAASGQSGALDASSGGPWTAAGGGAVTFGNASEYILSTSIATPLNFPYSQNGSWSSMGMAFYQVSTITNSISNRIGLFHPLLSLICWFDESMSTNKYAWFDSDLVIDRNNPPLMDTYISSPSTNTLIRM